MDSLTMLSEIMEISEADDLLIQLGNRQNQERQSVNSTPFESPISVGSILNSPMKDDHGSTAVPNTPHRLSVLGLDELSSSPPRVNKRKQGQPHRSIKQLASLAEKIINGIVVIEPRMVWEVDASHHKTIKENYLLDVPSPTPKRSKSGGNRNGRRRDELKIIIRSPVSDISRSPSPDRELAGSPANNPNSKPNSMIGKNLEEDFEPTKLAARTELYNTIYRKRKSPGSLALLGTSRLSGFGGTPLDISQAPGASLLEEPEFELCSLLRLQPLQYFQSRDTLIRNYHERGFYKKSAAQKMLHIDVNKTGRLYDFFVRMGWMPEAEDAVSQASIVKPPEVDWKALLP